MTLAGLSCRLCGGGGFYLRKASGEVLCRRCFAKSFEKRVRVTISKFNLFEPSDRIAVAVSGGKDSLVLLSVLSKLTRRFPKCRLMAMTVDEGVGAYRKPTLAAAADLASSLGVEHHIVTFEELYGVGLDSVVLRAQRLGVDLNACSFCGVLRRNAINLKARSLGADKVATGHNLDDEAETVLINMLRGDFARLARAGSKPAKARSGFVPRVKPLRFLPEKEVALYAFLKDLPFAEMECPYVHGSMRDDVRSVLNEWEAKYVNVKYTIVGLVDRLAPFMSGVVEAASLQSCGTCGEPSTLGKCRVCTLLEKVGVPVSSGLEAVGRQRSAGIPAGE